MHAPCIPPLLAALLVLGVFLPGTVSPSAEAAGVKPAEEWMAEWIGVIGGSKPNTWICYRKRIRLDAPPQQAFARIACDSKYWLWINGDLVVFEGQLKRGPTPHDTYFDRVDLTPWLRAGDNTIAVLMWHFGVHGYSHNSSGAAALIFDARVDGRPLLSDVTWKAKVHPAFGTTIPPKDNVRQPEPNLRFDARHDLGRWQEPGFDDDDWGPSMALGRAGTEPWGRLYERPIPLWRDSGLLEYPSVTRSRDAHGDQVITGRLPHNCQATPYLKVRAPAGRVIRIETDQQDHYARLALIETHRHEYVTRAGEQEFELPAWINGHEIRYAASPDVEFLTVLYRETSYDAEQVGAFHCDDPRLNQLWEESRRTLCVNMRDTYMDCPDRERAQWWGDVVSQLGEAFYVFDARHGPRLARKAIYELCRWQRANGVLYSPVPSGVRRPGIEFPLDGSWDQELPQQMLASVGWYGFWTFYRYTGDEATIVANYPAVKRYLDLWNLGDDGLVVHRSGDWDWTDWGDDIDVPVVENAWYYLALRGAAAMAGVAGHEADVVQYDRRMASIRANFNAAFWQGDEYRSPGYGGATDDRANAMAVVAGLAPPQRYAAVTLILQRERHASPYMEKYVLEALMLMDQPVVAQQRMTERYAFMLADDQSTLWELFEDISGEGSGALGRGTFNHAWSGGPLTILSQYVAGVSPIKPAFEEFRVRPQLGALRQVDCSVPTPLGTIRCRIDATARTRQLFVSAPDGSAARVDLPDGWIDADSTVRVNDVVVWDAGRRTAVSSPVAVESAERDRPVFLAPAGDWRLTVTSAAAADGNRASAAGIVD